MKRKLRTSLKGDLFLSAMRSLTYLLLLLSFFGVLSITNWQLIVPNRTMAVTLLTFVSMLLVMSSVYGGYAVGKKKSKPVISSMSLSVIATDLVTYLQLQIMNVNPTNNMEIKLFGIDFLLLLGAIAIQVVIITIFVRLGNNMYFRITPPEECCIITGEDVNTDGIIAKIAKYKLQYHICEIVSYKDLNLEQTVIRNQTVFLLGIPEEKRNSLILLCYKHRKNILSLAELEDIMLSTSKQTILVDLPFLEMENRPMTFTQRIIKRLLDICVAVLCLIITSPIMLIASIAIWLDDGTPILFKQLRMTHYGKIFEVVKFRTMTKESSSKDVQHISVQHTDNRITRAGHFLRRFRIDELPQLINVLRGEMSIVGPRPEMLENVAKYKQELPTFVYRERIKAGITGYAQIEGRYNTLPKDKLMLDLMYIENYSVWLDIKLIFRTLTVFFKKDSTAGFSAEQTTAKENEKN